MFIPETSAHAVHLLAGGCARSTVLFCSTGKQGFNRNLTVAEIIGQLWLANKPSAGRSDGIEGPDLAR